MRIENRCPHSITLVDPSGQSVTIDKQRPSVRIRTSSGPRVGEINGVPLHGPPRFTAILNLPPKQGGVVYVVSQLAALAIAALSPDRDDVCYPGTAPEDNAVRSNEGRRSVLSVSRLIRAI